MSTLKKAKRQQDLDLERRKRTLIDSLPVRFDEQEVKFIDHTQDRLRQSTWEKFRNDMAVQNLGIITNRCLFWYRFVPLSAKDYYDIEDMISDVTLHVLRHARNYDTEMGRQSTFIWHLTDNQCKTILNHFKTQKLSAYETIRFSPLMAKNYRGPNTAKYTESLNAVERVIQFGSDSLLDFVEALFNNSADENSLTEDILKEFRKLAAKHSATFDDFMLVRRYI